MTSIRPRPTCASQARRRLRTSAVRSIGAIGTVERQARRRRQHQQQPERSVLLRQVDQLRGHPARERDRRRSRQRQFLAATDVDQPLPGHAGQFVGVHLQADRDVRSAAAREVELALQRRRGEQRLAELASVLRGVGLGQRVELKPGTGLHRPDVVERGLDRKHVGCLGAGRVHANGQRAAVRRVWKAGHALPCTASGNAPSTRRGEAGDCSRTGRGQRGTGLAATFRAGRCSVESARIGKLRPQDEGG